MLDRSSLLAIRRQYRGLFPACHQQRGSRAIASAIRYLDRNPAYAAEQAELARALLPMAQAIDERERAV